MNVHELAEALSALKTVGRLDDERTYVDRVPERKAFHFFRPFLEDVVLSTSMRNADEGIATALAFQVLDTLEKRWNEIAGRDVAKLLPWTDGPVFADALLVLGRGVADLAPVKGFVLRSRSVAGYPINHIEWTGEETAAEATVRKKDAHLNDLTRAPSPIIFGRYQLSNGAGSAKHFAVAPLATILSILKSVVREGGRFEIQNYEREGCLLTTTPGSENLQIHVGGIERTVTHDEAVRHVHTLTHQGIAALLQELKS
jgi:hypothetical protein